MTATVHRGPIEIVAELRQVSELLAEIDDPAALFGAQILARWLAGEEFEAAAGLAPGWRRYERDRARDIALRTMIDINPGADDLALATKIARGLAAVDRRQGLGRRPDGKAGLLWDLARAECARSVERLRKLIASARVVNAGEALTTKTRDRAGQGEKHEVGRQVPN